MKKQTVAVLIPLYKSTPNEDELRSLTQCLKILHGYPIIFFCSPTLDTKFYESVCTGNIDFIVEYFDEGYFKDIHGYSKIMLSVLFYKRFVLYKFLLIYQLDAWIFRDDLEFWCNKNYDYVGAPWVGWPWVYNVAGLLTVPRTILTNLGYRKYNLVGNGGFSLRKTKSCISNLLFLKKAVAKFDYAEDYFFSFYINSYNPFFKIPLEREALNFSFDINPEMSFELNNKQLPFGCHAWPKFKDFWKEFIV